MHREMFQCLNADNAIANRESDNRKFSPAFTLLEILTVVAVIAIMVTASVVSVRQGQGGARIRGATRDIFATIRHARSMALVSQQPSVITYSTVKDGDDVMAKIEIVTAKMFTDNQVREATTLSGEKVKLLDDAEGEMKGGQTVEDILFSPISTDVVRDIRIKVTKEGETLGGVEESRTRPKISVFSNVDYLLGRLGEKRAADKAAQAAKDEKSFETGNAGAVSEDQEPVSVVWEANGRTEPHRVWIYRDGQRPEEGLSIKVDRFGGAKVLGSGENDE